MRKTVRTIEFTWEEKITVRETKETTVRRAEPDEPTHPELREGEVRIDGVATPQEGDQV